MRFDYHHQKEPGIMTENTQLFFDQKRRLKTVNFNNLLKKILYILTGKYKKSSFKKLIAFGQQALASAPFKRGIIKKKEFWDKKLTKCQIAKMVGTDQYETAISLGFLPRPSEHKKPEMFCEPQISEKSSNVLSSILHLTVSTRTTQK